jgi:hypothetical protein
VIRREGSNRRLIWACAAVARGLVRRGCLVVTECWFALLVPYDGINLRLEALAVAVAVPSGVANMV